MPNITNGVLRAGATTVAFNAGGLSALKGTMSYPFYANIFNPDKSKLERIQITGEVSADVANVIRGVDGTIARYWYDLETVEVHNTLVSVGGKDTPPATIGLTGTSATTASTGTVSVPMTTRLITVTPSGNCTFNATGGVTGQVVTFVVTTSGVTSRILTFGTNFRSVSTLATGTATARVFTISFIYDGVRWTEITRTVSMA